MKKRLITLLIAFVMMFTLIVPAYAADTTEAPEASASQTGGVDFYSITVNYTKEILVDYTREKVGKDYLLLFESTDGKNKVMSDKVVLRAGVTQELDYIGFDKSVPSKKETSNFYQLSGPSQGIVTGAHYSNFPYDYAYITHIQDGALLKSKTAFSFYGIFDPYDEGEPYKNQNPNVEYDNDGYALDKSVDANGKNYRIDANGYRIDADGLWYDDSGKRVELFYQPPVLQYTGSNNDSRETTNLSFDNHDELVSFDYESRFDENGKVKPLEELFVYFYISKDDYNKFINDNKETATASKPAVVPLKKAAATQEEADSTGAALVEDVIKGTNKIDSLINSGNKFKSSYFYVICSVDSYRVTTEATSVNDEGEIIVDKSKTMTDEVYQAPTTSFDSVFIARDAVGNRVYSTPIYGDPKLNVEIESITVEIDAVGEVNGDNDPQKNNKITVSLNDYPQNIALKEDALKDEWISQATFDSYVSKVLGTVECKTTTDKAEWNADSIKDGSYKSTVQSIKLDLTKEQLASIPTTASVFLSFDIGTHQPEEAFNTNYIKYADGSTDSSLYTQNAYMWTRPAEKEEPIVDDNANASINWLLIGIIAGSAVVVIAIVVVVLLLVMKKKK